MSIAVRAGASRLALFLSLASAAACTGTIADGETMTDDGADPGGGSDVTGGGPAPATPEQCAAAPTQPGPSPIRRLTRDEYNHSVHDLLNDTTAPGSSFPSEEVALNFPNNADVQTLSSLLIEGYETAAILLATNAVKDIPKLLGCDPGAMGEDPCMQTFIASFGLKAFRHPLTTDEVQGLSDLYTTSKRSFGFATAVRLTLQGMLQSPRFLYRYEGLGTKAVTRLTGYEIASRLSYLLWASTPDKALFDAAGSGALDTNPGGKSQAERMIDEPRATQSVLTFFDYWLDLERLKHADPKSAGAFPTFTPAVIPLLRQENDLFVSDVFYSGTLNTLLLGNYTFMNKPLTAYYKATGPAGDSFERVTLDGSKRFGFLTQAGFLAGSAKVNETAPVARGLFVRDRLLCNPPNPPPPNVPSLPPPDPKLTTRERLAQHRKAPACAGCHTMMDPIGFGLEHFDGAGLWRDSENGGPVDATGELVQSDVDGMFDGALELATKLSRSKQVEQCAVRQWFRFGYGRAESDVDSCNLMKLEKVYSESGGNFKTLVLALTQSDAFLYRNNEGVSP